MRLQISRQMWPAYAVHQHSTCAALYAVAASFTIIKINKPPLRQLNRWLLMRRSGSVQRDYVSSSVQGYRGAGRYFVAYVPDHAAHPGIFSLCTLHYSKWR